MDRASRIKIEQVPAQPSVHFLEYQLEPTQILLSQLRTQGVDVIDLARSSDAPTKTAHGARRRPADSRHATPQRAHAQGLYVRSRPGERSGSFVANLR